MGIGKVLGWRVGRGKGMKKRGKIEKGIREIGGKIMVDGEVGVEVGGKKRGGGR